MWGSCQRGFRPVLPGSLPTPVFPAHEAALPGLGEQSATRKLCAAGQRLANGVASVDFIAEGLECSKPSPFARSIDLRSHCIRLIEQLEPDLDYLRVARYTATDAREKRVCDEEPKTAIINVLFADCE